MFYRQYMGSVKYLLKIQRYAESIKNFAHSTHIGATVAAKKLM